MIVQKTIGVTDPVVMYTHVLKEVQEKEAVVIGLLFKHNAPYESTSRKFESSSAFGAGRFCLRIFGSGIRGRYMPNISWELLHVGPGHPQDS